MDRGGPLFEGNPLKNANGAAAAGGRREHLQIGSSTSVHALRTSSPTHVLQLLLTLPCPRRPHHQLSQRSYFSNPQLCRFKFWPFLVYVALLVPN